MRRGLMESELLPYRRDEQIQPKERYSIPGSAVDFVLWGIAKYEA